MTSELLRLVTDTLAFLKEDKQVLIKNSQTPPPIIERKVPPIQPKQVIPEPPPPPPPSPKREAISLIDKIQKHLPHLQLVQTVPIIKQVALVVSQKEDLPFLKGLKEAIEKRFYPVKMIDGEKMDQNWDQFELVLSHKKVPTKRLILLATIATYQNNTEQKKLLWSAICRHLS